MAERCPDCELLVGHEDGNCQVGLRRDGDIRCDRMTIELLRAKLTKLEAERSRLGAELASLASIYASDLRERGHDAEAEALESRSKAELEKLRSQGDEA